MWSKSLPLWLLSALVLGAATPKTIKLSERAPQLQNIVTWDEHSLLVHGERIMFYSGEFHPYRLPSPGLYLDIFQKIKALGYNGVSFYVDWALLEGEQGVFRADGIFDLQPFFDAASQAGIYLLARPGPYINAESSGGGFPGWLQTIDGQLRTNDTAYEKAQALYIKSVGKMIAKGQITNGGPVILVQPENEYTNGEPDIIFPNYEYFGNLETRFRNAGIVVPFINNEAWWNGLLAPGQPASANIYGYDDYPGGFDCAQPYYWADGELQNYLWNTHVEESPTTPHAIVEFQGGGFDSWGGYGFDACAVLLGAEFERVFYKNNLASGVKIMNFYMTYGGTNWGNLGYAGEHDTLFPTLLMLIGQGGYTSYDYGAVIMENRAITRQKYAEAKLLANFVAASPDYLTATPGYITNTSFVNNGLVSTTQLLGANNLTTFYVTRQTAFNSNATVHYMLSVPTSKGMLTIPRLNGHLSLIGRDSKIQVTDYDVGGHNLLYSSADIFTWGKSSAKIVLVVYGEMGERHELAFIGTPNVEVIQGSDIKIGKLGGTTVLNWQVTDVPNMVQVGNSGPFVYLVSRQTAYKMWVLPISYATFPSGAAPTTASPTLIASGGYLIRNATVSGQTLALVGDLNATASLEIMLGAPSNLKTLMFNGQKVSFAQDKYGTVSASLSYTTPTVVVPNLLDLEWKYHDSLPEILLCYDDSLWTNANLPKTFNIDYNLTTPTSLFSSDYKFNTGSFIFRGHFTASGVEDSISITTQGGEAYGMSAWLNSTFLGSFPGNGASSWNSTFALPNVVEGNSYVLTVVIDDMGYDENWFAGDSGMKNPRGILDYELAGRSKDAVTWKITGNLGGDSYVDKTRGPLNEGAMFAERQGWHLPNPPTSSWNISSPMQGLSTAGIGFYSTSFDLNVPSGYDVPMSFVFDDTRTSNFRVQLYVNGYQFGKYIPNIGPQTSFPVPEGILNHHGINYIALTLWAHDATGAMLPGLTLSPTALIQSGYGAVPLVPMPAYKARRGAY